MTICLIILEFYEQIKNLLCCYNFKILLTKKYKNFQFFCTLVAHQKLFLYDSMMFHTLKTILIFFQHYIEGTNDMLPR